MKSLVPSSTLTRGMILLPATLMLCLSFSVTSQEEANTEAAPAAASSSADVERGRYLVENVAMCGQCHSPRNASLEVKDDQWLRGARVPVDKPDGYPKTWAYKAPRIAGLPQYTDDEQFITFITTGMNRDGKEAQAPMPPYRMSKEDAKAIAAYLRSLP